MEKLKDRMEKLSMSARAFDRVLRVARTIADLENSQNLPEVNSPDYEKILMKVVNAPVLSRHKSEAIGYRCLDRSGSSNAF